MPLSNNSITVVRFWHNYRSLLMKAGVKASAVNWLVRHAEAFVKATEGRRRAAHLAADVKDWLDCLGRTGPMQAWQFAQAGTKCHGGRESRCSPDRFAAPARELVSAGVSDHDEICARAEGWC
jgi:hypothetical protein